MFALVVYWDFWQRQGNYAEGALAGRVIDSDLIGIAIAVNFGK